MPASARPSVSPVLTIVGVLVVIVVILAGWVAAGYNGLITGRETVHNQWAQIETTYQRRFDLIPNLVNSVKGASKFEQDTFVKVTEARTGWVNATDIPAKVDAAQKFDSAIAGLRINVESYPQLKATQAYQDLMTELEGTENRIAVARRDYNDAVLSYNVRVQRFPGNILASMFGFSVEKSFQSDAGASSAPSVNF